MRRKECMADLPARVELDMSGAADALRRFQVTLTLRPCPTL